MPKQTISTNVSEDTRFPASYLCGICAHVLWKYTQTATFFETHQPTTATALVPPTGFVCSIQFHSKAPTVASCQSHNNTNAAYSSRLTIVHRSTHVLQAPTSMVIPTRLLSTSVSPNPHQPHDPEKHLEKPTEVNNTQRVLLLTQNKPSITM